MELVTRLLNFSSLLMVIVSGVYIQRSFSTIITFEATVLVWATILIYMVVLVEINFGILRRFRLKL